MHLSSPLQNCFSENNFVRACFNLNNMERIYIEDLSKYIGQEVLVKGSVDVRRDHGKLIFLDIRDFSGKVQSVALPNHKEMQEVAKTLRSEWIVSVRGKVNERPEKMVNNDEKNGSIELELLEIKVLNTAIELPFEKDEEVNIDTHLDYLPLTLRGSKYRKVFAIQSTIVGAFRDFFRSKKFTEIQVPKLIGEDAEGGANSFEVPYFKHIAHLAQSPQLYKQIMVGVFERVFTVGNVYRAEKHSTTRHLNEYTSLDIEMGFIEDHKDVMKIEGEFLKYLLSELSKKNGNDLKEVGLELPLLPDEIPSMKLREAQELIKKETGKDKTSEPDLEPEDEKWLCEYAKNNLGSDFIFITHFPISKRPFYTYPDEEDKGYTKGFDLLFRGIEITTGAERIHDYKMLLSAIEDKGLNKDNFAFYLQAFKCGIPPHGGFGMGLERLTQKFLGLSNVKEATLFPRDLNRIDMLLSK